MSNIFEQATRTKLRFATTRGNLTVEDLWGLKLTELDDLAVKMKHDLEAVSESFLTKRTKADKSLSLSFEILKHIITTRVEEDEAREKEVAVKERQQKLLSLIEQKQEEGLRNLTIEELKAQLEALA